MRPVRQLAVGAVLAAVVCTAIAGCSLYKPRDEAELLVRLPDRFNDDESTGPVGSNRWWEDFADPELDHLVTAALAGNMDLGGAWARLDQALAVSRVSRSELFPQADIGVDASRSQSEFFAGQGLERQFKQDRLFISAAATYEVDVWKRVWSLMRAGQLDSGASFEDVGTLAMSLAAQTADAWVTLIEQRAQRQLLAKQEASGLRFLKLTELRFGQGLASALDVYQQRQQLAATRAQIPIAQASIEVVEHEIDVLRGQTPGGPPATSQSELPELPPIPSTGLPANLLLRRPDLRAASLRVAAADHRVASAVADRLPALRLTASSGWQSFTPAEKLFDSTLWTIAGNVAAPLIDGGRRRAEVDRTKAVVDELLHEYSEAFLGAVQEVEDALVSEREQRKHLAALGDQVRFSGRALGEAQLRYVTGLSDYLPVLAALQTLQEAERLQLTARRDLVGFRIQLYRALGGTWTNELDRPERVAGAAS